MFVERAKIKKKKKGVIVDGPFLILMRERDKPASMGITAMVRHVRLRPGIGADNVAAVRGNVRIGYYDLMLSGIYGNNGIPVPVERDLFIRGVPVPESIYELWHKQQDRYPNGQEEMAKWGRAVMEASRKHKPTDKCYRCGEPRDTMYETYPCTKCAKRLIAISKTIRIQAEGIPSAEEFGNV